MKRKTARRPYKLVREILPTEFSQLHLAGKIPKVYLVDQIRGKAYPDKNYVVIPKWAADRESGFLQYYIAHELSHIVEYNPYHDSDFYKTFMQICPAEFQYHELSYKPTAAMHGIKRPIVKYKCNHCEYIIEREIWGGKLYHACKVGCLSELKIIQ